MLGIGVATAALIIVLSALNGMEGLLRSLYGTFDPDLKICAAKGKSFIIEDDIFKKLQKIEGVAYVAEVIEDNALLKYKDRQLIARVKGVSDNFLYINDLDSMIVQGSYALHEDSVDYAIVGRGIQYRMQISIEDRIFPLQFIYPKNKKNLSIDPANSFNTQLIMPGAIFAIEKQYDDTYIFVPLSFAKSLLNYGNKRSALELKLKNAVNADQVKEKIKQLLGNKYLVQNSDEQHSSLLKAVKIEKLFVYLTFSIIIGIASFNLFLSLTMLVIEKRKDIAVLKSIGANKREIKKIFVLNGCIIAFTGAFIGLIFGLAICWIQIKYGLVSMGMKTSVVDAYPIVIQWSDIVLTIFTIVIITLLISLSPADKASKVEIKDYI